MLLHPVGVQSQRRWCAAPAGHEMEPAAIHRKEPMQPSLAAIWIRDILLLAVLLQAVTTSLAVGITAPVPAALAAVFLVGIIKLLHRHFETYQEQKEGHNRFQHDRNHWQVLSRLSSIITSMERLVALDGPIVSMTATVNKLEQDYKCLQQGLQQACDMATSAQEDAQRKDLVITSLQKQLAEAKRPSPAPQAMPAGLKCTSAPSQGASMGYAAGSLLGGLGIEEMPAMTRTPGHSELGAPTIPAAVAPMTDSMDQSVVGNESLWEQHPVTALVAATAVVATVAATVATGASGGKAAGDGTASSPHAGATDTFAGTSLEAAAVKSQHPEPSVEQCLQETLDGPATAGVTSPGLIDAIKRVIDAQS